MDLTEGERTFVEQLVAEGAFEVSTSQEGLDDPRDAWSWDNDRVVRAEVLRGALMGSYGLLPTKPISIAGVLVDGSLELEHAALDASLAFVGCSFSETLELASARLESLSLLKCQAPELSASLLSVRGSIWIMDSEIERMDLGGAQIGGDLALFRSRLGGGSETPFHGYGLRVEGDLMADSEFAVLGLMSLRLAVIGGRLQLDGARLENPADTALLAEGLSVGGDLRLGYGAVQGGVALSDARVGGSLRFDRASFTHPGQVAVDCDRVSVERNVRCDGMQVEGQTRCVDARIGGRLSLSRARLVSHVREAFLGDGATIRGGFEAKGGFDAHGEVRLVKADISGGVSVSEAQLRNPTGAALTLDACRVRGSIRFFAGITAVGEVRLAGARVDDQVTFQASRFERAASVAVNATALRAGADVLFDETEIIGGVLLDGAEIGGQLVFASTTLEGDRGVLVSGDRVHVKGDLRLGPGFSSTGSVRIQGAEVGGALTLLQARFESKGAAPALSLHSTSIAQRLLLRETEIHRSLDLSNTTAGVLDDTIGGWPARLGLSGFSYGAIAPTSTFDPRRRLEWLARDVTGGPQPYEQLMDVCRRAGHDDAVRMIGIAKLRHRRQKLSGAGRAWSCFLDKTVGYGYRTWLAVMWLVALLALSTLLFGWLQPEHIVAARRSRDAVVPTFNALMYSLDVVVPLLDMHQRDSWIAQGWAQWFVMGFALAGWLLSTVTVAALTGLLKRE